MANTHQENHRFKLWFVDGAALLPVPILGYFRTLELLYATIVWIIFCAIIGSLNYSALDVIKMLWHMRTRKSHSRLINDRD